MKLPLKIKHCTLRPFYLKPYTGGRRIAQEGIEKQTRGAEKCTTEIAQDPLAMYIQIYDHSGIYYRRATPNTNRQPITIYIQYGSNNQTFSNKKSCHMFSERLEIA